MKVIQINSVYKTGSTGRIVSEIESSLIAHNHESYIFYGRGKKTEDKRVNKFGNNMSLLFHIIITRLFDKHGFGSIIATKNLIRKIKRVNPDIIHLHNIHGYYINIKLLFNYLKVCEKRIIWTLHDCWPFTGHCSHYLSVKCCKWETVCEKCPQKKKYPKSFLLDNSKKNYIKKRNLFSKIDNLTIITPSIWLKKNVTSSFLSDYQIELINNGIDLTSFKPTSSKYRDKLKLQNKFIILGVANFWNTSKGIEFFIELSNLLDDRYQIILVGRTNKVKTEIPKKIITLNNVSTAEELAKLYSLSNLFLNPTLEDTFPTVNIESLACGTPVMTFDSGGSKEIIDSKTGIIVPEKTVESIFKTISENFEKLISDKIWMECVERAKKFYNSDERISDYIRFYLKM